MDYTAIDFETATSCFSSICSMGICVVENNKVTEKRSFLIKPEPFEFYDFNIAIHGITPQMVEDCGTFDTYWTDIKPYLENKIVIAHNAQFDVGALRATLDMFGIEYPEFNYLCTVKLSQKAYPELKSYKLNYLSKVLGINLRHHIALDDACACSEIFLRILKDYKLETVEDVVEKFDIGIGKLCSGYYEPCRKNRKN